MALDPALRDIVSGMGDAPARDLAALPVAEAIEIARALPLREVAPPAGVTVENQILVASSGASVHVRLYRPQAITEAPVLLHFHGGGWVSGAPERDDARCGELALAAQCVVVSVRYRLAPEDPYPAAVNDALVAWTALREQSRTLNIDPKRMAVSGSSAGAHIAVALCTSLVKSGNAGPLLQLLTYPALDPYQDSLSYDRFQDGPFLTKVRMAWYWQCYASGRTLDELIPWRENLLSLMPRALILTAEYDPLRDDGERYLDLLSAHGVDAQAICYPGMIHGFLAVIPRHVCSREAMTASVGALLEAFA